MLASFAGASSHNDAFAHLRMFNVTCRMYAAKMEDFDVSRVNTDKAKANTIWIVGNVEPSIGMFQAVRLKHPAGEKRSECELPAGSEPSEP